MILYLPCCLKTGYPVKYEIVVRDFFASRIVYRTGFFSEQTRLENPIQDRRVYIGSKMVFVIVSRGWEKVHIFV